MYGLTFTFKYITAPVSVLHHDNLLFSKYLASEPSILTLSVVKSLVVNIRAAERS